MLFVAIIPDVTAEPHSALSVKKKLWGAQWDREARVDRLYDALRMNELNPEQRVEGFAVHKTQSLLIL